MEDKKNEWESQFYKTIDRVLITLKLPLRTDIEARINAFVAECKSSAALEIFKKPSDHRPTKAS